MRIEATDSLTRVLQSPVLDSPDEGVSESEFAADMWVDVRLSSPIRIANPADTIIRLTVIRICFRED